MRTAISSFPRAVLVTSVIGLAFLPPLLGSNDDYSPTAPSLNTRVPRGSLMRREPVQVYHHQPRSTVLMVTTLYGPYHEG
jgi:hypothetical protein